MSSVWMGFYFYFTVKAVAHFDNKFRSAVEKEEENKKFKYSRNQTNDRFTSSS